MRLSLCLHEAGTQFSTLLSFLAYILISQSMPLILLPIAYWCPPLFLPPPPFTKDFALATSSFSCYPSQPFFLPHFYSFLSPTSQQNSLQRTPQPPHSAKIRRGQQQPKNRISIQQRSNYMSMQRNTSDITTVDARSKHKNMKSQHILSQKLANPIITGCEKYTMLKHTTRTSK